MKAYIQTTSYPEYKLIYVYLVIRSGKEMIHLKGFDDTEWREATKFAEEVSDELGIEYVGEVGEANHELDRKE